ncbi:DUF4114 domain-containing protein [Candidatus Nitrosacidococcus sp. I8]|uniref:DUF4114 domain-containing protein n=1 Tax=Candidatus Nitrosacidococcus sp. I8 TaxID=2942908 RepID=UPI002226FD76|nr:DUF4114 domain-containing protein [Candidatus Nitrosacidococcus sp. I8]CAH9018547.1 hypothetical protein NURINAE_00988 [Candidatus Nitrosacidococcus sp. I8]
MAGAVVAPASCPSGQMGSPVCISTTSSNGAGKDLQSQINNITTSGPNINVYTDQTNPSDYWSIGATGVSENSLMFEIAANAGINSFGIYDPNNPKTRLQLFSGTAGAGYTTSLSNPSDGNYVAQYSNANGNFISEQTAHFSTSNLFGYYLTNGADTFYSDPTLNGTSSLYPEGNPNMVAIQGNGETQLQIGTRSPATFLLNEFILAWEDTALASSNHDYNDFVVMVESVHPNANTSVPEPAILGLFGLGLLLMSVAPKLNPRRELSSIAA